MIVSPGWTVFCSTLPLMIFPFLVPYKGNLFAYCRRRLNTDRHSWSSRVPDKQDTQSCPFHCSVDNLLLASQSRFQDNKKTAPEHLGCLPTVDYTLLLARANVRMPSDTQIFACLTPFADRAPCVFSFHLFLVSSYWVFRDTQPCYGTWGIST